MKTRAGTRKRDVNAIAWRQEHWGAPVRFSVTRTTPGRPPASQIRQGKAPGHMAGSRQTGGFAGNEI